MFDTMPFGLFTKVKIERKEVVHRITKQGM